MWTDARRTYKVIIACVVGILIVVSAWQVAQNVVPSWRQERLLHPCSSVADPGGQVECIFRAIDEELHNHSIAAAMQTFTLAYTQFPSFLMPGCHRQAHRVGDMAYYEIFLGAENLESIDLPQSTTACGYGFFHGFMEHLIQDHPNPAFVTKTCDYLQARLGDTMADIRQICYHGSGHGFTLAYSEQVPRRLWGNLNAFTTWPLSQCGKLSEALPREIEECKEGVFNVVVDWMELHDNGFSLNKQRPLLACDGVPRSAREACYYEMSQKLDGIANKDPVQLSALVQSVQDMRLRKLSFQVGIAGIVQNIIWEKDAYKDLLAACNTLPKDQYLECLQSLVRGLYEHGTPQSEYVEALSVCSLPSVLQRNEENFCYQQAAEPLPRFYTDAKISTICYLFPEEYRPTCTAQIGSHEERASGSENNPPPRAQ